MKLQAGDYYLENGNWVFTKQYHLRRGWCCNSGCRHCPYKGGTLDNKEKEGDGTKCPMCGRIKSIIKQEDHLYFCPYCDMQFDDRED